MHGTKRKKLFILDPEKRVARRLSKMPTQQIAKGEENVREKGKTNVGREKTVNVNVDVYGRKIRVDSPGRSKNVGFVCALPSPNVLFRNALRSDGEKKRRIRVMRPTKMVGPRINIYERENSPSSFFPYTFFPQQFR